MAWIHKLEIDPGGSFLVPGQPVVDPRDLNLEGPGQLEFDCPRIRRPALMQGRSQDLGFGVQSELIKGSGVQAHP